ncbi:MAG: hypothetical protein KKA79_09065, partial [Nanoarchaeota archaeon]|nr:hypothetical protein [Nanoarchaeota archaeon]
TLKLIVSQPQIIFLMLNDTDCVLFGLSKDYEGHKTFISDHLKILQENKCILNDPLTELISVPKIKFQKTEFAPLVKKIFDLDVKF